MTFWIIVVLLCLAAVGFAVWPLWRKSHRLTPLVASVIVFTVAASAALYNHVGSPGVPSGRSGAVAAGGDELPGMDEALKNLEKRLANNPDDINGWKMLARTHLTMRNFDGAVAAYERVMELENGQYPRPRKHTISLKPGEKVSLQISADAPGEWAFHCHLLYHMEAGMFRVVSVV